MQQVLIVSNFQPFLSGWGVWCKPVESNGVFYVPLGWEDELTKNGVAFEIGEIVENDPNELP